MKIGDWTVILKENKITVTNSYGEPAIRSGNEYDEYFFIDGTWYCRADLIRWWRISQAENFDQRTFY